MIEYDVNYRIINPKAISIGQLYGSFDPFSHEWTDGVLAKTFREMVYALIEVRSWIMFDGPVDAIWIENLNTVLGKKTYALIFIFFNYIYYIQCIFL